MDDREIIERVLAGRRDEFEALVERYQRTIHGFVRRQVRAPDDVEEIVQMTFVRAYVNLPRYRGEASFSTWLHQIALNLCRAHWHRRSSASEVQLDEIRGDAGISGGAESDLNPSELHRLVQNLPPRQRSVFAMRIFSDMPFKDIALATGTTENSAKVSYHHAVMKLRRWLRS